MRQGSRDIEKQKKIARLKYKERQIEKYMKWAANRGFLRWGELVEIHNKYNVKVYGEKRNNIRITRKEKNKKTRSACENKN